MPVIPDTYLDGFLDQIADGATKVSVCSSEPANYAAVAAATLGTYTVTAGDGGGDYTIANGDTSGRKLTLAAQSGTLASATGTGTHLAFHNGIDTLYATLALSASVSITTSEEFTIATLDVVEIRDPS